MPRPYLFVCFSNFYCRTCYKELVIVCVLTYSTHIPLHFHCSIISSAFSVIIPFLSLLISRIINSLLSIVALSMGEDGKFWFRYEIVRKRKNESATYFHSQIFSVRFPSISISASNTPTTSSRNANLPIDEDP
jgi:hypothetical protein